MPPCPQWGKEGFWTEIICKSHIFINCASTESAYMHVKHLEGGLLRYMWACRTFLIPPCPQWGKEGLGTVNICRLSVFINCASTARCIYACESVREWSVEAHVGLWDLPDPALPTVRQGGIFDSRYMQITLIYLPRIHRMQWTLLNNHLFALPVYWIAFVPLIITPCANVHKVGQEAVNTGRIHVFM